MNVHCTHCHPVLLKYTKDHDSRAKRCMMVASMRRHLESFPLTLI